MSDYSSLKATINANIKANNNHEITGAITNSVLNAMVNSLGAGYQFIGVATPTNPGSDQSPDYKCFYLATTPGTYSHLGGLVVADGEVAILKYDTSWTKEVTGIATAESVSQLGQQVDSLNNGVDSLNNFAFGGVILNPTFDQLNHFAEYGYSYGYSRGHYTPKLSGKIDGITFGPFKYSGDTVGYEVYKSSSLSPDPTDSKSLIASGTVSVKDPSAFQEYFIEVPEIELQDEYVYVYFDRNVYLLGQAGYSDAAYNGSETVNLVILYSNSSQTWSFGGSKYTCVSPRCSFKQEYPKSVYDVIKEELAPFNRIINLQENASFNGSLLNYNFDSINHFLKCDSGYGTSANLGQISAAISGKINGVFVGPIKGKLDSISYEIYKSSSHTPEPSGKTLLKSGTISGVNIDAYDEYFIEIPETTLDNEYIYVYFTNVYILGQNGVSEYSYTGEDFCDKVILKSGGNWYFGGANYQSVSPRLVFKNAYPKSIYDFTEKSQEKINVNLPNRLYAVVGDTLQVFYRSLIESVDPYKYDIRVICEKGAGYKRYFSYTPTTNDIGTAVLTIRLYNDAGVVVGGASCELVTVAAPSTPSSIKKIFTFGDSLTGGGEWCNEANRRLTNNNVVDGIGGNGLNNIDFCGKLIKKQNNTTTHYFGAGGWTWESYTSPERPAFRFQVSGVTSLNVGSVYSNNGHNYTITEVNITDGSGNILCSVVNASDTPEASGTLSKVSGDGDSLVVFSSYSADSQNPLWDYGNDKMTFIPYVNQYGSGQLDVVYVLLTWNHQSAWKEYSLSDTTQITYAKQFARTLHTEYPNAKLKIVGIQMPSLNGGLARNYGANSVYSDVYGLYKCAWSYNRALQDLCNDNEFSGYCEYVDAAAQFDSENNMPERPAQVNIRNTKTEEMGTNGVHPAECGYFQIADAVYRNFVANYCQ